MDMQSKPTGFHRASAFPIEGWRMARMRFWNGEPPGLDPPLGDPLLRRGTGWLDKAKVEAMDNAIPEEPPVEIRWASEVNPTMPATTLAGRLGEMSAAYDWVVPETLKASVAEARAALKQQPGLSLPQQQQMVQAQWPGALEELGRYERRNTNGRIQATMARDPSRPRRGWEDAQRQAAEANARSYVDEDDPFLHHPRVPGLDSFLPHPRGLPPFHVF